MKALGVILLAGGAYYLWSRSRAGQPIYGGLRNDYGWGAQPLPGSIYDPTVYAGGRPSYAGSSGVGNTNPITSIISSISTALAKSVYRQPTGSAPAQYGKQAGPAVPGGPSGNTGVVGPSGYSSQPLYQGSLVDPIDPVWNYDTMPGWYDEAINATPADIQSQNVSQEIYY